MNGPKDYYSPDEVADLLDLHVRTVRRYIRDGELKATRIGKQYRIAAADLNALLGFSSDRRNAARDRRVLVSATVDIDAISREEADRLTTGVTGAFNVDRDDRGAKKRVDCIYYEEQASLRIVVNADAGFTMSMLQLIDGVLADGRDAA